MRVLFFLLTFSGYSIVSELNLDQNFKAGDTVSAETFNTIFRTIEKINSVVKDEDLIGTWSCSGKGQGLNSQGYSNWTSDGKPAWYSTSLTTSNITVTFASSGASPSYETPYSYTQAEPILHQTLTNIPTVPLTILPANLNGSYVLIDNEITLEATFPSYEVARPYFPEGIPSTTAQRYTVSILTPTRIRLKNDARTIICDKQ